MLVISKDKQKAVDTVMMKVDNGLDVVAETASGNRFKMGTFKSLVECKEVIDGFIKAYKRGDKVYEIPKLPNDHIL